MVLGHPLSCVILCQGRTGKRASRVAPAVLRDRGVRVPRFCAVPIAGQTTHSASQCSRAASPAFAMSMSWAIVPPLAPIPPTTWPSTTIGIPPPSRVRRGCFRKLCTVAAGAVAKESARSWVAACRRAAVYALSRAKLTLVTRALSRLTTVFRISPSS